MYGKQAIYFEYRSGEPREQTLARLEQLTTDATFREQITQCTEIIHNWITTELPQQSEIFTQRLTIFEGHLLTDFFSDRRDVMYSQGKKWLEFITVSLSDVRLPESFRKEQIRHLLSSNALEVCPGGCLGILSDIGSTFQSYYSFSPARLKKEFIKKTFEDVAINPLLVKIFGSTYGKFTVAEIIRNQFDLPIGDEIHVINYLKNKVSADFPFLAVDDDFQKGYDNLFECRGLLAFRDQLVADYLTLCLSQLTANNLVDFIASKLQALFSLKNVELTSALESQINQLGVDKAFSLHEVLEVDEAGNSQLKQAINSLKITIAERLVESGYLGFDTSQESRLRSEESPFRKRNQLANDPNFEALKEFKFLPDEANYRIYYNNIELSWVKEKTKDETRRRLILDVLKEEGPEKLRQLLPTLENVRLLDHLIQSTDDLVHCIKANQATQWLSPIFEGNFESSLLSRIVAETYFRKEIFNTSLQDFYFHFDRWVKTDDVIVRRLLENHPQFIKRALVQGVEQLSRYQSINEFKQFSLSYFSGYSFIDYINHLNKLGFADFTDLHFKLHPSLSLKRKLNLHEKLDATPTLFGIEFMKNADLKNSIFEIPLIKCSFEASNLESVEFKAALEQVYFYGTYLENTDFSQASLSSLFSQKFSTISQNKPGEIFPLDFQGSSFSKHSFLQVLQLYTNNDHAWLWNPATEALQTLKHPTFNNIKIQAWDFSDPESALVFERLNGITFRDIEAKDQVLNFGKLLPQLKIENSLLENVIIRGYSGQLEIAQCNFINVLYEDCDLSRSNIFEAFFGEVKFQKKYFKCRAIALFI